MAKGRAIVAAGHPQTAGAAMRILSEGGNAFDAVLAAMAAACVTEPVLASLGGGGFLMAKSADQPNRPLLYDFFAENPRAMGQTADLEFFPIQADFGDTTQEFHIGRGAIATPGCLYGLFAVHRDLGQMPLREVLAPAIELAKAGVVMHPLQAGIIKIVAPIYARTPELLKTYGSPDGDGVLKPGERFALPDFADFLDVLAIEGEDLVRRGEVAKAIVEACGGDGQGGLIGLDDLNGYDVLPRAPLAFRVFGHQVLTNPAPSSGGLLMGFGLHLLESQCDGAVRFGGAEHLRLLTAVFRASQHVRQTLDINNPANILDQDRLSTWVQDLGQSRKSWRGTTQISVIDQAGSAASLTLSNGEGSGITVPGTGIMLNNMLGEEDINPDGFHNGSPGVRLCSMMAPSLVEGPDVGLLALGSGGSNRIRTAMVQALFNILGLKMALEPAVGAARLHVESGPINVEPGFPENGLVALENDGEVLNRWEQTSMFFGGVHVARSHPAQFVAEGVGDPRRGGVAHVL